MIFARRRIDVTFIGPRTVKLENLRVHARITNSGGVTMMSAQLSIFGMTLDHINDLSTYGQTLFYTFDYRVIVEAGDDANGMNKVFEGTVAQAWGDFQGAPIVPFNVVAYGGLYPAVQDGQPTSATGQADVPLLFENFANQMGYKFENNGVAGKLWSWYSYGAPRQQALALAEATGVNMVLENGVLAIWPPGGARAGGGLLVSPSTGMVSYPTFTEYGVMVRVEFTRPIPYGTDITIQSDLKNANGTWNVRLIDYDLQSRTPKGHWFANLGCMDKKFAGIPLLR